jgi:uncharacterized protein (TIGR02145 family)
MVENLKTTKYRNGIPIPLVDVRSLKALGTTAWYCWPDHDVTKKNTFGALYNWFAIKTGELAPTGWHVPTDDEWEILIDHLGGAFNAGGKMKSTGTIEVGDGIWHAPNTGATNESGFAANPAGDLSTIGSFFRIGNDGFWWSSSQDNNTGCAWTRIISSEHSRVSRINYDARNGFSVRCIQDL